MSKLALVTFLIVTLVLAEAISLVQIYFSLTSNANYWRERSSQTGELTYVALGDSAAQGIGASRPANGYVGLLAGRLAEKTGKTIRVVNLSVSGAKIKDVIDKQIPQIAGYRPDFVTIEVGANDIVKFDAVSFSSQYNQLITLLPNNTIVSNMPNFGGRIKRDKAVMAANKIIAAAAAKRHLRVADLYSYTKNNESPLNYAADFFHPSNRGYRNWANAFWVNLNSM